MPMPREGPFGIRDASLAGVGGVVIESTGEVADRRPRSKETPPSGAFISCGIRPYRRRRRRRCVSYDRNSFIIARALTITGTPRDAHRRSFLTLTTRHARTSASWTTSFQSCAHVSRIIPVNVGIESPNGPGESSCTLLWEDGKYTRRVANI